MDFLIMLMEYAKEHGGDVNFSIVIDPKLNSKENGGIWINAYKMFEGQKQPAKYTQEFSLGVYKREVERILEEQDGKVKPSTIKKIWQKKVFENYIKRVEQALEKGAMDAPDEDEFDEGETESPDTETSEVSEEKQS